MSVLRLARMLGQAEEGKPERRGIERSEHVADPPSDAELARRLEALREGRRWDVPREAAS